MLKVTIIGAGSAVFARQIMTDILAIRGLDTGTFALIDIDPERLALIHRIAEHIIALTGKNWHVSASTERRDLLADSDFIINAIDVAGLECVRSDYDIPRKYGVDQCIGDTIGPGGIFKALRTGPVLIEILRDAEQFCPHAIILNYTNPMSILTLLAMQATMMQVVGLCHSVQHTAQQLARYLDLPITELEWDCAGINHNAWFTKLRHNGQDLYPQLRERASNRPEIYEWDPIRFEMMLYFGAFVTESSGHFSEYVPYFRKRPDLIKRYCREGYRGESGFYANNWPSWRMNNDAAIREMLNGDREIPLRRSNEYAATIIEAIIFDRRAVIYGNVRNNGLIANLPDGCVEVACLVNRNGIHPSRFGELPEQLAALNRSHMAIHKLVVDAILNRDKQAARYALLLDPLSAAVCSPAEISALFDELWEAQHAYLQTFI